MTDRSVLVFLRANVANYNRNVGSSAAVTGVLAGRLDNVDDGLLRVGKNMDIGGRQLDRYSGRLKILADLAAVATPAVASIGAVGAPAFGGLLSQMGATVITGGAVIGTFQGIGDALEAVNKARLEPTAENLAAARMEIERLSPAGQRLIRDLERLGPVLKGLRDAGAGELFPGVSESLDNLEARVPDIQRILLSVNDMAADMLERGTESLASDRWDEFFDFLATDVPPITEDVVQSLGSITHALSELWMATDPLNDDFSNWLVTATDRLDRWASGLSQTRGFQEFIAYVRENGPQVGDTLSAIALAVLRIFEAAAPLGGPVLAALEGVAEAISAIADSDAGPAIMATVTALALLRRGMATYEAIGRTAWATNVKGADTFTGKLAASRGVLLKGAGALTGIAVASSGVADGFGLSNTASMALMGTLGGPWGAAIGGAIGLVLDFGASHRDASVDVAGLSATLDQQTGAITRDTKLWASQALEQAGAMDAAKELGIAYSDLTSAALGNADAQARVDAQIKAVDDSMRDADGNLTVGTETWDDFRHNMWAVDGAITDVNTELGDASTRIKRTADAAAGAVGPNDDFTASARRQAQALRKLYEELAGVQSLLEDRQGLVDYERALDAFTKRLRNRRGAKDFFDVDVEAGRKDFETFKALMDPVFTKVNRLREAGRDAAAQRVLTRALNDLEAMNVKTPVVQRTIQRLREKVADLNAAKAEPKVNVDTTQAKNAMDEIARGLRAIKDEDVFVNVTRRYLAKEVRGGPPGRAAGGPVAAGRSYVVGEHRPELFVPEVSGRILPSLSAASTLGGGSSGRGPGSGDLFDFTRDKGQTFADVVGDVSKVVRQLKVDLDDGPGGVRRTLRAFQRDLKDAGGEWTTRLEVNAEKIRKASERYDQLTKSVDAQQVAVDDANAALENIKGQQTSFESAIAGQFKTDLFGGGLAGLDKALSGDISGLGAKDAALQSILGMGVDPTSAFFRELAEKGDIKTLQQLAAAGPAAVAKYADLYAQRDTLGAGIGSKFGSLSFGAQVDAAAKEAEAQTAVLGEVRDQLKDLQKDVTDQTKRLEKVAGIDGPDRTAKGVGAEINDAFLHGWLKGKNT